MQEPGQQSNDWLENIDDMPQSSPLSELDVEGSGEGDEDTGPDLGTVPETEIPEWMQGEAELPIEEPPLEDLVPDWLAGDEEPEEDLLDAVPDWLADSGPSVPMMDETGGLSEDWLHSGDDLPETSESEQTFDEWMAAQEAAERGLDLEAQLPSMSQLSDTGELPEGRQL